MITQIGQLSFGGEMGLRTAIQQKEQVGGGFEGILQQAIANVEETGAVNTANTQALLSGEVNDLAQVMIDGNKASTALNLVVTMRNKAVDAYNEIMRMQV